MNHFPLQDSAEAMTRCSEATDLLLVWSTGIICFLRNHLKPWFPACHHMMKLLLSVCGRVWACPGQTFVHFNKTNFIKQPLSEKVERTWWVRDVSSQVEVWNESEAFPLTGLWEWTSVAISCVTFVCNGVEEEKAANWTRSRTAVSRVLRRTQVSPGRTEVRRAARRILKGSTAGAFGLWTGTVVLLGCSLRRTRALN